MRRPTTFFLIDEGAEPRVFSDKAIFGASFFGGPFAGLLLVAHNFRSLGDDERANKTLMAAFAVVIGFILLFAMLPGSLGVNRISTGGGLIAAFIVRMAAQKQQGDAVLDFIARGGQFASFWSGAGIVVGSFLTQVFMIFLISTALVSVAPETFGADEEYVLSYSKELPQPSTKFLDPVMLDTVTLHGVPDFERTFNVHYMSNSVVIYDSNVIESWLAENVNYALHSAGYFDTDEPRYCALYDQGGPLRIALFMNSYYLDRSHHDKWVRLVQAVEMAAASEDEMYSFDLVLVGLDDKDPPVMRMVTLPDHGYRPPSSLPLEK